MDCHSSLSFNEFSQLRHLGCKKSKDGLLIQKNLILLRNEKISIDIIVSYPNYGRNEQL